MDRSKQAAAVVVIAIGLIIVAIGAVVLLSELKKERETREKLEEEISASSYGWRNSRSAR